MDCGQLVNGQRWRSTASSGESAVANGEMRGLERAPAMGAWGEESPPSPGAPLAQLPFPTATSTAREAPKEKNARGKGRDGLKRRRK